MRHALQQLVARQLARDPRSPAICFDEHTITYEELEESSSRLASFLAGVGCEPGARICLLLGKTPQAVIAQLGILKAGCICVPVDVASPLADIESIIRHCEPAWFLSESRYASLVYSILGDVGDSRAPGAGVLWLDDEVPGQKLTSRESEASGLRQHTTVCKERVPSGDHPAYIYYTLGSRDRPKGCVLTHANVLQFIEWAVNHFGIESGDTIAGHNPLNSNLSLFDMFGAFRVGATIRLLRRELDLTPTGVKDSVGAMGATHWLSMPATMNRIAKLDLLRAADLPALRHVMWSGAELSPATLRYWMARLPHVEFTNLYGCSEVAVASSYYSVSEPPSMDSKSIPIGMPCPGQTLVVLDRDRRALGIGDIGHLFVGGTGLGPGYWSSSERTEDGSPAAPLIPHKQLPRLLNTGDLASQAANGSFTLHGRIEQQIESGGRRIGLVEVERILSGFAEIRECVVLRIEGRKPDEITVCCAYVPVPRQLVTPRHLRHKLSQRVPDMLIPPRWLSFPSLPRNGNGKVDQSTLKRIFSGR